MLRKIFTVAAIAALTGCGGGGGSSPTENKPTSSGPPGAAMVQVGDNFFNPQSLRISSGQTVQWTLVGRMTDHTVTDTGGAFDSGFLPRPGATFTHTFSAADAGKTFHYQCQTHASLGMKGTIEVQ